MHALGLKARKIALMCAMTLGLGCSDDGVVPESAPSDAGGSSGGASATSSVNTTATVTATATEGDDGLELDLPPMDPATGTGATSGVEDTDPSSDESGSGSTGEPPEPDCVGARECTCDPGLIICESLPPPCPPDMVPLVDERTSCWEDVCVPIESCSTVLDCAWCDEDEACVSAIDLTGPHYTCQPIEPTCPAGVPTCECMPMACEGPFFECMLPAPGATEDLQCVCPTC